MLRVSEKSVLHLTRFSAQSGPVHFEPAKKWVKQAIFFLPFSYYKMNQAENEPQASGFLEYLIIS